MEVKTFTELLGKLLGKEVRLDQYQYDAVGDMLKKGFPITFEDLRNLLISSGLPSITQSFYQYFFPQSIATIKELEAGIEKCMKIAMLHFGNFEHAFRELSKQNNVLEYIDKRKIVDFEVNRKCKEVKIKRIDRQDLPLLGYVSGKDLNKKFASLKEKLKEINYMYYLHKKARDAFSKLPADIQEEAKKAAYRTFKKGIEERRNELKGLKGNKEYERWRKQEEVKAKGNQNTKEYLKIIDDLDVYVATSMRDEKDYFSTYDLISEVFSNPKVSLLKLNYFDPTQSYIDDPRRKGLLECLMIKKARVLIYNALDRESLGKDSELSSMLVQGKPAIVYVPEELPGVPKKDLDARADTFKEIHPLTLQVCLHSGVAHGVIVVRNAGQCAEILEKLFRNTLETYIEEDEHNYLLKEKITGSVIRVVTKDSLLTNYFWEHYHKKDNI